MEVRSAGETPAPPSLSYRGLDRRLNFCIINSFSGAAVLGEGKGRGLSGQAGEGSDLPGENFLKKY